MSVHKTYRTMVVGLGKRGMHHALAFQANERFEVVGLCDVDRERLTAAGQRFPAAQTGADAAELAMAIKPDVFCFCTMPHLRSPLVRVGIECGARLVAFEKPLALTSREAREMKLMFDASGVRAVVSHQHRYGEHYRKVKEIAAAGHLGRVETVYASSVGWMTHILSHLVDYARWYLGEPEAEWVMAQASGRGKLGDNHPSPDYLAGVVQFAGDVRGIFEAGAGAPNQPDVAKWWGKNRICVQGTEGFAEVLTNGGWRAVTRAAGFQSGSGAMNYDLDMPPYIRDIAAWLDDDQPHPCRFESAYKGFEITAAMQRSVAAGGQVALPLRDPADEQSLLAASIPDRSVLASSPVNAKEYGL